MTTFLFDADVLIALSVSEHEHRDRASAWAGKIDRFAVCPVIEDALARFLVRTGETPSAATDLLRAVYAHPAANPGRTHCPTPTRA